MFFSKKSRLSIIFIMVLGITSISAIDNAHYFKTPYFHATKSWNTQNWLSLFDLQFAHGDTCRARDCNGNKVGSFDIYGNHNLLYLTSNVPQPTLSPAVTGYVTNLNAARASFENDNPADKRTFGLVEMIGKCRVDEFVFNYRQNFISEFFAELNIPIRRIRTGPITINDKTLMSATPDDPYTQSDTRWTSFRDNLEAILQEYGFTNFTCGSNHTSVGDIALLVGWQHKFSCLQPLFKSLQFSCKAGALFPSGNHKNFSQPFSLENGYNGHLGIPVRADLFVGLSYDIFWGLYAGLLSFSSKDFDRYPVKTHTSQNGFIKLLRARLTEKKGNLIDLGTYLTLDYFFQGLSATVGYSYTRQESDTLCLLGECGLNQPSGAETTNSIINNDNRLKSWHMHVLHLQAIYDFGYHNCFRSRRWSPQIGIFYDYPFEGKRIFINPMLGGSLGITLRWDF